MAVSGTQIRRKVHQTTLEAGIRASTPHSVVLRRRTLPTPSCATHPICEPGPVQAQRVSSRRFEDAMVYHLTWKTAIMHDRSLFLSHVWTEPFGTA